MYNDDWSQLRNAAHLSTQHGLKFKVVRITVPRSWAACPSQRVNILRYSMFCHFISFLDEFDKNESGISEGNCGRIGPISGLKMASVSIKSSLTFTGDSWLHLSRVGMFQDLGTSLRLDVIVRPSGLIAKTSKKMSQAEMIIFKCLLPVWTPGPRVVQHGPRALSLCSSHHSALDFINTLFNLASSQCKPKYSMELAVSASTGSGLSCACVCVCECMGTVFFGEGGEWKHLILLDQEALNHAGSSWKDPEGAGPGRLDPGRLSEPEPGLSLTPSWWRAQILPHPCRNRPRPPSAHQVGTLQAFSCTGKCFQPWLRLWLALITSASGTLKTRVYWSAVNSTRWARVAPISSTALFVYSKTKFSLPMPLVQQFCSLKAFTLACSPS